MEYQIEVREVPAAKAITVRETVPRGAVGDVVPNLIDRVEESLAVTSYGPAMLSCPEGSISRENHPDEAVEIEAGFIVSEDAGPEIITRNSFGVRDVPARRAATTTHVGPYDAIGEAYEALRTWMKENGVTPASHCEEIYLTRPGKLSETEYKTVLVWPLQD